MSQFAIRTTSGYFGMALRWNRCGFRWKRTRCKKKTASGQNVQDTYIDITESQIYCPFINESKSANHETLSALLVSPLSIRYSREKLNSERLYLGKFHSVTSILSRTKPPNELFGLINWTKAQISELGDEQFKEKMKTISKRGTRFHHDVQAYFKNNEDLTIEDGAPHSGYWKSIRHVLHDISNVVAIESSVMHPLLGYAGTLDLIAEYKGSLAVIDWKTSAKHKTKLSHCYSYPQQIVAYCGAVNYDQSYPFQVHNGVIVIAYENGDPADVHYLSQEKCETYWLEWLTRLQQYRQKFPEPVVELGSLEENVTAKGITHGHNTKSEAKSLEAKSLSSIGIPVAQLGKTVKDDDVMEEEELSKEEHPDSWEQFGSSDFRLLETWKTMWKSILQFLSSRGKTK